MVNDKWLEDMPHTNITHLPSVGSDHYPLLMEMITRTNNPIKYFRFLNFWTDHSTFLDTVKECWDKPATGDPMYKFHQKLKRFFKTLSNCSKDQFGDIFAKVKEFKKKVRVAEEDLITHNSKLILLSKNECFCIVLMLNI